MKGVTRGPARFRRSHSPGAVHAVLRRELRAALLNRYLQLFSALALAAGIAAVASGETEGAAPFFLLHVSLYFVSLFALATATETPVCLEKPLFFTSGYKKEVRGAPYVRISPSAPRPRQVMSLS